MALIEVRKLTKYYRMGDSIVRALDEVDLDIEDGEFIAITGPSGSGKSTMMHLLGCLDRPTRGEVRIDQRPISRMSDRELALMRNKSIGFVFQTFNLINRTSALDNVRVPLFYARQSSTRDAALKALERVGLGKRARHTPSELSGGERQRVAIARAIVNNPLLVLADEPTGNLDSRTGEQIMELFHALNQQGVTLILVTHEPDVAMQAKRIVQMRDGKIVADTPTEHGRTGVRPKMRARDEENEDVLAAVAGGRVAEAVGAAGVAAQPTAAVRDSGAGDGAEAESEQEANAVLVASEAESEQEANAVLVASEAESPRLAPGTFGAMVTGILSPVLFALGMISFASLQWFGFIEAGAPPQYGPDNPVPPAVIVLGLGGVGCILMGIVSAVIAIFWGRAVVRRVRFAPIPMRGLGFGRCAVVLGSLTIIAPVALFALTVVRNLT